MILHEGERRPGVRTLSPTCIGSVHTCALEHAKEVSGGRLIAEKRVSEVSPHI